MGGLKKKITALFELPKEVVLNLPLITITGNEQIAIENFKGVVEYTDERIRIKTSSGVLKITGTTLSLKQLTSENILVTGRVLALEYLL